MTVTFFAWPRIEATDKSRLGVRKKKPETGYRLRQTNAFRKYDHQQMFRDRMSGLTWEEVAKKHGVCASSHFSAGYVARALAMNSRAVHQLKPFEVDLLERADRSGDIAKVTVTEAK